jgi:hypothetical protein
LILAVWLVSLLAVAGFALVLARLSVAAAGQRMLAAVMAGLGTMLDREMDDDSKERAVRRAGLLLLGETGRLGLLLFAALAAAALPIYAAEGLGMVPAAETLALMLRVDYLLIVSAAAIALLWLWRRRNGVAARPNASAIGGEAYGVGDRLYHLIAFSGPGFQRAAAALDDRLFAHTIARTPSAPPVFVTSLARGGTTALLNAFHDMAGIATHEYRDMPFVTAPLLWSRLSGGEDRQVARRARAHGDGLEIDLGSPEAFDELFWMMFWPGHYSPSRITLWNASHANTQAQAFFVRQFQKIAHLRRPTAAHLVRYLSKNNANIARLRLLPAMFPGCDIVIPLRSPGPHAASLLRQHQNFLALHARDAFSRLYMRDIGHLEFGALHRPLAFPGFDPTLHDPASGDYWLAYWIAAFRDLAAAEVPLHIVTQDDLRAAPQATMQALVGRLGLNVGAMDFSGYFRPEPDKAPAGLFSAPLLAEADALYAALAARAVR